AAPLCRIVRRMRAAMISPRMAAVLGLSLLAAACASDGGDQRATPGASPGAPTPVEGYDWFFHEGDGGLSLAYGVADSDDVRLSLDCRVGAGQVALTAPVQTDAVRELHLESGGETERLPALAEPSLLHDGVYLTAETASTMPVLQRFRQVGWMAV